MKPTFFPVFVLMATASFGQPGKSDRSANHLQGQVKSVKMIMYSADEKFGELTKSSVRFSQTDEYNKAGLLVYSKETDRDVVTEYSYKYDKNGNPVEKKQEGEDEVIIIRTAYNGDGTVAEVNTYDGSGKLKTKLKKKYNARQLPLEANLYHGDGSLKEKEAFEYNDKDLLVTRTVFNARQDTLASFDLSYDSVNKIKSEIQVAWTEEDDGLVMALYEHDSRGRLSAKYMMESGEVVTNVFEYDDFGNLTKDYNSDEDYQVDEYTYDKRNNWIKQVRTWVGGVNMLRFITERTITYY